MLRVAGVGLGTAAVARTVGLRGAGADAPAATTSGGTRSVNFGADWKFVLVNPDGVTDPTGRYADAPDPGFDDSSWRTVNLPHDWSIGLTPVDTSSTSSGTGFLQGGLGWYRKTFTLPRSLSGKRISIEFDGVYMNSRVYFNGQLLGRHPYAYTGFGLDLTDLGILLMVEAFDCWHTGKVAYDYHLYFDAWGDRDIKEMVHESKNSPAVVLWSIGNETPDTGLPGGPAIARRLIDDVRSIDRTRPIVMGSDKYRTVPPQGSPPDRILRMLDGLGLNYNTAMSIDALHARYPGTFFFESESSSETSTRGVYQDPQLLNTGENYTPGKRATSSYDNNLAPWTMSGEYSLKKDRDRRFFAGEFLWAGQDYIGEPTPYDVFPVKSSFFGAADTAGFAKDAYDLFTSQWAREPMVHIVPMNWTGQAHGENVAVWVYSNVETVELFLNGSSLGVKSFDRKTTTFGREYLETTEPTGDDKNYPSGSYTSPNGSTGKLHLTWNVPFRPGRLTAVATRGGRPVARDEIVTAGRPHVLRLTPDRRVIAADGTSLSFLTVGIVDSRGLVVPGADNRVHVHVAGQGTLAGVDNGREENAQSYQAPHVRVFNGKALAIVESTRKAGRIRITATSPGLRAAAATLRSTPVRSAKLAGVVALAPTRPSPSTTSPVSNPASASATGASGAGWAASGADASYSGAPDTLPAAMLDGDPSTGWSNYYVKPATATLNAVSVSRRSDWVSLWWHRPRRLRTVTVRFTTSSTLTHPSRIAVTYWDGHRFVPVRSLHIDWSDESNGPTVLSFDPVHSRLVRLDVTSPTPGTGKGFMRIAAIQVDG
ncbi:MAG: DUF4982 domain-containing protein [Streptosporangiaceae bacterium]